MNDTIRQLEPQPLWNVFADICEIPRPSGHTAAVADFLTKRAEAHHLTVRRDSAGNLRIDRPAAPGWENKPRVIMQGHMDMVPQKEPGKVFDFEKDALELYIENGKVRARGTTLGADDGMALMTAMTLLCDDDFKCGPLSAVFTVDEEIGLIGAKQLDPEFLEGDIMLNIDDGAGDSFIVGCAGGLELHFTFDLKRQAPPQGQGIKIAVRGLIGGHSGCDIDQKRGNALIFLARLAEKLPLAIAEYHGGEVANAISRDAELTAITALDLGRVQAQADKFAAELAKEFDAPQDFGFTVSKVAQNDMPNLVWNPQFQIDWLHAVATMPNGVLEFSEELQVPQLSSNLGVVKQDGNKLVAIAHPRGFADDEVVVLNKKMAEHFAAAGGTTEDEGSFPGWTPNFASPLCKKASVVFEKFTGKKPRIWAVHAGLEAGLFIKQNPHLDIIATGPDSKNPHTPQENLDIASMQEFFGFVKKLLQEL